MQVFHSHELDPDTYSKIIKAIRARGEGDHEMKNVCCCQTLMISLLITGWSEQKRLNDQQKLHPPRCGACFRKNRDDVLMNNSCTHK